MEALLTFAVVLLIAIALLSVLAKRRGVDDNFVRRVDRWRVRYWTRHRRWPGSKRDPLVRLTRRRSQSWSDDSGPRGVTHRRSKALRRRRRGQHTSLEADESRGERN